jgi:hypothetical protein
MAATPGPRQCGSDSCASRGNSRILRSSPIGRPPDEFRGDPDATEFAVASSGAFGVAFAGWDAIRSPGLPPTCDASGRFAPGRSPDSPLGQRTVPVHFREAPAARRLFAPRAAVSHRRAAGVCGTDGGARLDGGETAFGEPPPQTRHRSRGFWRLRGAPRRDSVTLRIDRGMLVCDTEPRPFSFAIL